MIGKITSVAVHSDRRLEVRWDDGVVAPVDFTDVIAAHKALAPLRKKAEFARVAVSNDGWSLEWPCGVDFGAEQVRAGPTNKPARSCASPISAPGWMSTA